MCTALSVSTIALAVLLAVALTLLVLLVLFVTRQSWNRHSRDGAAASRAA